MEKLLGISASWNKAEYVFESGKTKRRHRLQWQKKRRWVKFPAFLFILALALLVLNALSDGNT
ncbi:hypothetical protein PU634_15935 [Oceanimonas pelagia]|uniref:Uncharacterized protein n=1 Tax=Oceanimonas pelagia TaxID=3028314 RepID=A0AA50KNY2_9GAMM|nr:hypothetical protein [Oceanimonas pelagia]WMC10548.1 hypothetical protein PU634_15935 [Oceanimonas pelagia]